MSGDDVEPTTGPNVLGVLASLGALSSSGALASLARSGDIVAARGVSGDAHHDATVRARASGLYEEDDVTLAWELARLAPAERATSAFELVLALLTSARSGSTRLSLASTPSASPAPTGTQLSLPFAQVPEVRAHDLAPLVGADADGAPLVLSGAGHVALRRWAATERMIATDLRARGARGPVSEVARETARTLVASLRAAPLPGPRGPMALTSEQEEAVAAMLVARTVVLTGGPGTGKTSVVVSLLRALARRAHGEGGEAAVVEVIGRVALAAPTGKAADRLGEAVRAALARSADPLDALLATHLSSPMTLHRLLGYRHRVGGGGSFRAHRHNPLSHQLVLVDEVSMLDTVLFARLLSAVAGSELAASPGERVEPPTLVLLGDADQLPSVDPGAVLRDILHAQVAEVEVHTLTQSHRMDPADPDGAHVLSVARACLAPRGGAVERFRRPAAGERGSPVGRGGAWHVEGESVRRVLEGWMARHLFADELARLDGLDALGTDQTPEAVLDALAHLGRARLLAVTRRTATDLDAYVSAAFARWRGQAAHARRILAGEPIMVVHNDYDEDLWNGDSGVAWRDRTGELFASFRRGARVRTRPLAAIAHLLERSHAVTVHKAQGSEHDEVVLVLPSTDTPLSSREIVYTAITRARRSALVVGGRELLEAALARGSERDTGLADALRVTR